MDARYRSDGGEDDRRALSDGSTELTSRPPTREEIEYAEEFEALSDAIEACPHSDLVAILLSTCRNQWMAANAAVVDLSAPLKSGKSRVGGLGEGTSRLVGRPDASPIAVSIERLRDGHISDATQRLDEAAGMLSLASDKLNVWDRREELMAELEAAVATLDAKPQARVRAWLSEQRNLQTATDSRAVGEYLALSVAETAEGRALLSTVRDAHQRLAAATHVLLSAAKYFASAKAETQPTLLEEAPSSPEASTAWSEFQSAVAKARHEGGRPAIEVIGATAPPDTNTSRDRGRLVSELMDRALAVVAETREGLARDLQPNRPRAPLPPPYIIDVTPRHPPSGDHGTQLSVIPYVGRTPEVPSTTRVALLRCGVPKVAYQEGALYQFRRSEATDHPGRAAAIARNAVARAAELDATAVVMPECFVPYDQVESLRESAERAEGLLVVAGVEHRPDPDGRAVNSALIIAPGMPDIEQRKQRPSVYEVKEYAFAADATLRVLERTPLGTLAVVVCSDYLESNIVWALASHRPPIDTLVVPTRNPNPDVFSRLASADALRLHANVVIANGDPGHGDAVASGHGTGVVSPKRSDPWLTGEKRVQIDVAGWEGNAEPPCLALFDVTVAALSGRNKGRTKEGLAGASHFVTES